MTAVTIRQPESHKACSSAGSTLIVIYQMTVIPFDLKALVYLAISTLLPFLPVVVMTIPLKELLHEVASLLL